MFNLICSSRRVFIICLSVVLAGFAPAICRAQTVIDSDFSKGDFAALGWKAKGDWEVFMYPKEACQKSRFCGPLCGQQARRFAEQIL